MTAEASFAYKGFAASLSTAYSRELKVTVCTGVVEEHSRMEKVEREYQADGVRVAECLWFRGDRYAVERVDGTKILEWNTLDSAVSVLDGYGRWRRLVRRLARPLTLALRPRRCAPQP